MDDIGDELPVWPSKMQQTCRQSGSGTRALNASPDRTNATFVSTRALQAGKRGFLSVKLLLN